MVAVQLAWRSFVTCEGTLGSGKVRKVICCPYCLKHFPYKYGRKGWRCGRTGCDLGTGRGVTPFWCLAHNVTFHALYLGLRRLQTTIDAISMTLIVHQLVDPRFVFQRAGGEERARPGDQSQEDHKRQGAGGGADYVVQQSNTKIDKRRVDSWK